MNLLDPLFGWEAADQIFSDSMRLQRMLDFESALARAEARLEIIPKSAVGPIASQCRAELLDMESLARAAADAGNLAIPMVKQLTSLVARRDKEAAGYVHWGATSQDVIDTGLVLQLKDIFDVVEKDLERLSNALAQIATANRATPLAARTWMQQAVPTTFGLKAAGWLDALNRHRGRLHDLQDRTLVLQFGGAAGTLSSLGKRGLEVANVLGEELRLSVPAISWHAHRDRLAEVATTFALLTGTLGKMARDISLQTQTEVAELFEPAAEGRGGSSTMPHKRNPVNCAVILAAAERVPALTSTMLTAMSQEHERGLGGWQAEWETLPELIRLVAGALHRTADTIEGLEIDAERMRRNLDASQGLIFAEAIAMALANHIGKPEAHRLVEDASKKARREKKHLQEILSAEPAILSLISATELAKLFEPLNNIGVADQFVDRVLAAPKSPERR